MIVALQGARGAGVAAFALAAAIVLPFVPGVYTVFAANLVCFALFAVSFDLLLGFTGLLSFGHALFWGGGAYVATIALAHAHLATPLAILVGTLYAAVASVLVGLLSIRRAGIYFAMITLALAQLQFFIVFQLRDLTGGENGLHLETRGTLFGLPLDGDRLFYYVVLLCAAAAVAFALRVIASPFGMVLAAMRENEQRARSVGYDVQRFKLVAFVMSGTMAGLAGALYALNNRLVGLDVVDWHTSGAVVMMTILGGIGTIYGAIVGAALFQSLEYFVSKTPIGDKTNVVMGTIFAIVILTARRGIVGELLALAGARRPAPVEEEPAPAETVGAEVPLPGA
ncbi:MAG: branched-chain amino acid ABC transporter permease [Candidatus Velthaea sp.]